MGTVGSGWPWLYCMLSAGCSRFVEYMKAFSQWCMMVHAIIVFLSSINASSPRPKTVIHNELPSYWYEFSFRWLGVGLFGVGSLIIGLITFFFIEDGLTGCPDYFWVINISY